ncbi:hypothetical protein B0T21DRAFT_35222 [Apiosordaria backusii]|uniref:Uncharacterized protein n=1 Tax=Apiosordaria backusii TaxID=314023 RepID=A0AA40B2X9_9PEZI|nr:hypothetical protein B0T21DRAFT_35222 [Apiosordaria backusii]
MPLLALFRNRDAKGPTESPSTNVSKKRLRKKPFARLSETKCEPTQENSQAMGNYVSLENIQRPQRPPRAATGIPELPCLPIYETLTLSMGSSKAPHNGNSETSLMKTSGKNRPPSKVTPQNTSRVRFIPQEKTSAFKLVPTVHAAPNPQPTPKSPVHDRASILADSYRSILPDFDAMEETNPDPENTVILKKRPTELSLKRPYVGLNRPQSIYRQSTAAKQVVVEIPSSPHHRSFIAQIDSVIAPLSAASSITAVDNSERSSEEETAPPAVPPQAPQRKYQAMNRSRVVPQPSSTTLNCTPVSPKRPAPPSPRFNIPKGGNNNKSSLALQICTHMLTDELKKALFAKREGVDEDSQAGKLQVLLLIEAYEGVMDNCREQLALSEQEGRNVEIKNAKEAMEILGHWLDSLYEIYAEAFGDDDD